jgi:hypothetical protein
MAARKGNLRMNQGDLQMNANVRFKKLKSEHLSKPEIIRRDKKTGEEVTRKTYDKASGEMLEEGYGYKWMTKESGEEVPKERIQYFQVMDDGEEKQIQKRESTIGADKPVSPVKWISADEIQEYLVERVYEIWGENHDDELQLAEFANWYRDHGQAPVIPVVFRKKLYQDWGIITPYFDDNGDFSIIMRITKKKIQPQHEMDVMTHDEIQDELGDVHDEEVETVEQDAPF